MKLALLFPAVALAAAGCATTGDSDQLAQADDCKVVPAKTQSFAGVRQAPSTELERREAEMRLANSDFRRRNLAREPITGNTTEQALRDCATTPRR
ncbi:MAG TPA: hypothetical protein VFP44_08325 [Usitatibacter sp.]|nr:hypothetical protein [Usitatibacter sp.]